MVLVAGLAVAGVGGIAAAFYVSVRSGGARGAPSRKAAPRRSSGAGVRRPRSRGGWLRRADIDEELWPEDAFGGVTDEQFWDDLAADKPLATTARQPPPAVPAAPAAAPRRPSGASGGPSRPGGQPGPAASGPRRGAGQPAETPGRRRSEEDPLTSAAYSLRGGRSAGGRSYQSSRRPGYLTQPEDAPSRDPAGRGSAAYRHGSDPVAPMYAGDPVASMSTPPYGELYRYGDPAVDGRHDRRGGGRPRERQPQPQGSGYHAPWYLGDGYRRPGGPATDGRR